MILKATLPETLKSPSYWLEKQNLFQNKISYIGSEILSAPAFIEGLPLLKA